MNEPSQLFVDAAKPPVEVWFDDWYLAIRHKDTHIAAAFLRNDKPSAELARLFAAAPELLGAAVAAIAYDAAIQRYAEKGQSWVQGDDLDALYAAWVDAARDAIAKATGENHD